MKKSHVVSIAIAIIAAALLIILAAALLNKPNSNVNINAPQTPTSNTSSGQPNANQASTITYTDSGFSPATLTVASGSSVTFVNNASNLPLQVNSNPHPVHTDNPELNIGGIPKGQSKTITLNTKGNWGYHNHLNPSDQGRITVQ